MSEEIVQPPVAVSPEASSTSSVYQQTPDSGTTLPLINSEDVGNTVKAEYPYYKTLKEAASRTTFIVTVNSVESWREIDENNIPLVVTKVQIASVLKGNLSAGKSIIVKKTATTSPVGDDYKSPHPIPLGPRTLLLLTYYQPTDHYVVVGGPAGAAPETTKGKFLTNWGEYTEAEIFKQVK